MIVDIVHQIACDLEISIVLAPFDDRNQMFFTDFHGLQYL